MKKTLLTLIASLVATVAATAITIDSDDLIGTKSSATGNEATMMGYLNTIINIYNGGAGVATYTLDVGTNVPAAPLNAATDYSSDIPGVGVSQILNFGSSTYEYLMMKSGTIAAFYYIGEYSGSVTFQNDVIKNGSSNQFGAISHFVLFNRTSVPDTGSTLALLGAGLLALVGFRSRKG